MYVYRGLNLAFLSMQFIRQLYFGYYYYYYLLHVISATVAKWKSVRLVVTGM